MSDTYVVQAFDAAGNWLDTDARADGYTTLITGPREMLTFVAATRVGTFRDCDMETSTRKRIAYWVISIDGITREVYTTTWGRHCRVRTPNFGPGCRPACPVPVI